MSRTLFPRSIGRKLIVATSVALLLSTNVTPSLADDDNAGQESEREDRDTQGSRFTCVADKTRTYQVVTASLPFDALPGTTTERRWGEIKGAGYRIEVPKNWNGELVMWAHGFRGWGCDLTVDDPPIRKYLVDNGYAWAASSYATSGYGVQQGVDDTIRLTKHFRKTFKKPSRTYMTGASMGGHITGVAIEQHKGTFDGAMPVCGVMGSETLFDYFLDFNELAQAISGVSTGYPYGADYVPTVVPQIKAALGGPTSPKFQALVAATMNRSGGNRPGFFVAIGAWLDFLFGLGQPAPGVPAFGATNVGTVYQLDGDPAISEAEAMLNANVRRVSRLDFPTPDGVVSIPKIEGKFRIPVVSLHTIGDLFVPFSMEQIYAQRASARGRGGLLVQRAIRDVGHCSFTDAELNEGFADLATWVATGTKPAGDDVTNPTTVAAASFGCRFTKVGVGGTGARPFFGPCPRS